MEILFRGADPNDKNREFQAACQNCSTLVKFKRSEAEEEHAKVGETYLAVACPVCPARIYAKVKPYG